MTAGGPAAGPTVVLVGAPGSGKTTVGLLLAERLTAAFRDTDSDIEATSGRSVADIFVESGEAAFRDLERAAVAKALREHEGVLSLGGGAILDESTRALLGDHRTAWLRVTAPTAAARVGLSVARPLLLGNVRGRLVALLRERAPLYAEVADLIVDTDGREPSDIADEIIDSLALPFPTGASRGIGDED